MLIFIYGSEGFLIKNKIDFLRASFQSKYPNASLDIFDVEQSADLKNIQERLHQGGCLFSSKKMVVLRGVLSLSADEQAIYHALLKDYVKDQDTVVVIVGGDGKEKKNKLYKFLEKEAKKEKYDKLEGASLSKWINNETKERSDGKVTIHHSAIEFLTLITKGDLWKINQELEKLVNYKEDGLITVEDINQLCQGEAETKIFDLVDAISMRNKAKANELIFHLLKSGENEFYIFTMLIFQFRNLVKVSDCQKKGNFFRQ